MWRSMAGRYLPSGVIGASTRTTADTSLTPSIVGGGGGPTFGLTSGEALISGHKYDNSASLQKTSTNNVSGNPRVDRLVLKLDTSAKTITADILLGTPGVSPSPPSIAPSGSNIYLTIARATVAGLGSTYTNLVDERVFSAIRFIAGPSTGSGAAMTSGDMWFQTDTGKVIIHNGSGLVDLATVINGVTVQQRATAFNTTVSATYTNITGDPGAVFVAPASGKVVIHFAARMQASLAAVQSLATVQVRTGGAIGGGSLVYTATDDDAIGEQGTVPGTGARTILVPGLTAGVTYNVQMLYRQTGGNGTTDTAGFAARTVTVQPTT